MIGERVNSKHYVYQYFDILLIKRKQQIKSLAPLRTLK